LAINIFFNIVVVDRNFQVTAEANTAPPKLPALPELPALNGCA